MPSLFFDLRNTLRSLLRSPGFSALAILVLALGLGANLLLFNTVQALMWRPLPFPQPRSLVGLWTLKASGEENRSFTGAQAATLLERAEALKDLGLVKQFAWESALQGQPEIKFRCGMVSSGYFRTLGLRPLAGRLFNEEEDRGQGGEAHGVLTEAAWREVFQADPGVVGRLVPLVAGPKGGAVRIVGVLAGQATLPFAGRAQVLYPIPVAEATVRNDINNGVYRLVARLKPGWSAEQASAQATALLDGPGGSPGERVLMQDLRKILQPANPGLYLMLLGASGLLLLLTATNAASLFLARALERSSETAVRLALGARLPQLLKAQVLEAALISGAGLVLAFWLNAVMRAPLLAMFPELQRFGPELLRVGPGLLGFAAGLLAVTCGAVSLLPLVQACRPGLAQDLAQGGRTAAPGGSKGGRLLVMGQVAVILVLLSLGALLTRSLGRALGQGVGFDPRQVQVCKITLPTAPQGPRDGIPLDPDREMGSALGASELAGVAASLPGTRACSYTWQAPFGNGQAAASVATHEGDFRPEDPNFPHGFIGPDYFRTLGARMLGGREFSRAEVQATAPVAILNESAARLLLPGTDPLGKVVHSGIQGRRFTVVGLCADLRNESRDEPAGPMVYLPFLPITGEEEVTLVVRTELRGGPFGQALRQRMATGLPGATLDSVVALQELAAGTVKERLRAAALVGIFSLLGLAIGCIGLYGTLTAQVAARRREVGIRMALGSSPLAAAGRILAVGLGPVSLGAALGLGASLLAAHGVRSQLYGVEPLDLASHLAALGLLALGSLLAFLVPTLRTARMSPSEALRSE